MMDYAGLGCWDDMCSQARVKSFAQDPAAQWYFDLNCSSSLLTHNETDSGPIEWTN
ncbi:hypothetical protein CROQUDRAFT_653290, partial [Cronartium quercuum f. sp. fusiforme G11]